MNKIGNHRIQEALPSFFVLGAQKAGTTSLHYWLNQQPDICLPVIKETQFFALDEVYTRGIKWYISRFPECKKNTVIGEVAPNYMYLEEAAFRIRESIPSPKFIFIFRHPIERAFSNYLMNLRMGYEQLSFYEALKEEPKRLAVKDLDTHIHFGYMARGKYTQQVNRYKEIFHESKFLLIKFDDLVAEGETGFVTYKQICEFIGLNSAPDIADRTKWHNPVSLTYFDFLQTFLREKSGIKSFLSKLLPNKNLKQKIAFGLDVINRRPIQKPSMGKLPQSIIEQTREETILLQNTFDLDLNDWNQLTDNIIELNKCK